MEKQIWFTSDTHYNHKNICRGISDWTDKETTARDFQTLEQMNNEIVERINKFVDQDDELYHLGDWSFGGIESIWQFRQRIICKNVHLITGNHDDHIKKDKMLPNCSTYCTTHMDRIIYHDWRDELDGTFAQELFTSVQNYLELSIGKQIFVLSHYPIEEWYEMDRKGAIMLHGHVHHTMDDCELNTKYRRMDVGIDWKEFRPYSLEEIVRTMSKRERKQHSS